jgi:hypothetical protein
MHRSDYVEKLNWRLKFTWLPKRCIYNGGIVWLKMAYYASFRTRGPLKQGYVPPARTVHIWMRKEDFIIESLKGRI